VLSTNLRNLDHRARHRAVIDSGWPASAATACAIACSGCPLTGSRASADQRKVAAAVSLPVWHTLYSQEDFEHARVHGAGVLRTKLAALLLRLAADVWVAETFRSSTRPIRARSTMVSFAARAAGADEDRRITRRGRAMRGCRSIRGLPSAAGEQALPCRE